MHYYYYKSLLLSIIIMAPLAISAHTIYVHKIMSGSGFLAIIASFMIPFFTLQIAPLDHGVASFVRGSRSVSSTVNASIYQEMNRKEILRHSVVIYLVGTNESSDIASLLVQANRPHNKCFDDLRLNEIIRKITQTAVKDLAHNKLPSSCRDYNVRFLIGTEYKHLVEEYTPTKFQVEIISEKI